MRYLQGNQSGPAVINGGPNPIASAPLLAMNVLSFSNPISLFQGFAAPDLVTISCPFGIVGNPNGLFFLQGSLSTFGGATGTQGIPGPNDWVTLPNTPVPASSAIQNVNGLVLAPQPATFRFGTGFSPLPGFLFLRVGFAPTSNADTVDFYSVYAIALANYTSGLS
jgi:hypothetical protein